MLGLRVSLVILVSVVRCLVGGLVGWYGFGFLILGFGV